MHKFKFDVKRHIPIVISIIALLVSIYAAWLSNRSLRFEIEKIIYEKSNEFILLQSELLKLYFQESNLLWQVLDDIETDEDINEEERRRYKNRFKSILELNRKNTEDFFEHDITSVNTLWESEIKYLEANIGLLEFSLQSVRNSIEYIKEYISEHQEINNLS